ncbi:MAG: hypothetical protein GY759_15435 [Chloroflexi bacterium]|nr:hypothetical protein [Chloroflexota bacterium]
MNHPDLSQITDYLYLSSLPKDEHAGHIYSLGIRLVISMPLCRPPSIYRQEPFQFIHCPAFDSPITPIPQFILRRGVHRALPVIDEQEHAVLVHCRAGVHRSVAMACCILITKGCTSENAMKLVKEKRDKADPYAGYIRKRIEIFESNWNK